MHAFVFTASHLRFKARALPCCVETPGNILSTKGPSACRAEARRSSLPRSAALLHRALLPRRSRDRSEGMGTDGHANASLPSSTSALPSSCFCMNVKSSSVVRDDGDRPLRSNAADAFSATAPAVSPECTLAITMKKNRDIHQTCFAKTRANTSARHKNAHTTDTRAWRTAVFEPLSVFTFS